MTRLAADCDWYRIRYIPEAGTDSWENGLTRGATTGHDEELLSFGAAVGSLWLRSRTKGKGEVWSGVVTRRVFTHGDGDVMFGYTIVGTYAARG